jgi:lipoprotein-anchoring transpeptidase ErfK/SrfK
MHLPLVLIVPVVLLAQTPSAPADPLHTQVMLDRAGFSPGVIDGRMGTNTRRALETYLREGLEPGPTPVEALARYAITVEDVSGPFTSDIPRDMMQQASLPALGYRTPLEALAERFHTTPALLQRLNPSARFEGGEEILVPNVEPLVIPVPRLPPPPKHAAERPLGTSGSRWTAADALSPQKPDVIITVSKSQSALMVRDLGGRIRFYAPVTTGSEHDPLPIGEWRINGVRFNPPFRYNPDLFWDSDPEHTQAVLAPGPNNPVGLVWIDISKEHYGLHGTPTPETIGRTESHGCVRLTNWDALTVAGLVKPGTRILFVE